MTRIDVAGITLMETLVYLALFTIVIGGLFAAAYAFFESNDRNQTKAMLEVEQDFLIAKINWALDGARTISDPTANTSGGILTISKYNGTDITIASSGADVELGGSMLNNSNVTIRDLVFIHTKYVGASALESVEVGFIAIAKTPNGVTISQTASTTRYMNK